MDRLCPMHPTMIIICETHDKISHPISVITQVDTHTYKRISNVAVGSDVFRSQCEWFTAVKC